MNKEKLKHLWFNLLWCITSFVLPFFYLTTTGLKMEYILIISLYIYFSDVFQSSTNHYLEERIKNLEEKLKQNERKIS